MAQVAQVIPMKKATTWEDVRSEWDKKGQMGFQSVMQDAKVGQMLIDLKEATPHGEYQNRVSDLMNTNPSAAQRTAHNLMTLARHVELLEQHKPDSQRAALKIIKAQLPKKEKLPKEGKLPKKEKYRIWWAQALSDGLGVVINTSRKRDIEAKMGEEIPMYFTSKEDADAFVQRYITLVGVPKDTKREQLSMTAEAKIKRAIDIETAKLNQDFDKRVREAADAMIPERIELYERLSDSASEKIRNYSIVKNGVAAEMTKEDYKFLLGLLHPDRAPTGYAEKFTKAFEIVRKLDKYIVAVHG